MMFAGKIFAPVIIPTLCRYDFFKRCIESLARCTGAENTEVYIGLDYPAKESHWEGYKKILDYVDTIVGFKNVYVIKREYNFGAMKNSVDLRTIVTQKYDRWIYSEDDNVFSPNFLAYMNMCFDRYVDDPRVCAICGYTMPVNWKFSENNHFATRYNRAWGYGTWLTKYEEYQKCCNGNWICDFLFKKKNVNGEGFLRLRHNDYGVWQIAVKHLYMRKIYYGDMMMQAYLLGTGRYVICPTVSLVRNIGFGFGENYKSVPEWVADCPLDEGKEFVLEGDPYLFVEENEHRRRIFEKRINRLTIKNVGHRLKFFFKITLKVLMNGRKNRTW